MSEASNTAPTELTVPAPARRPAWVGWLGVGLLLVIEYVLFRGYVHREVEWAYPAAWDQCVYLSHSYQTYEIMQQGGLWLGIKHGASIPFANGLMLHLQASLFFQVLGPSRLSALTLNFLYYALFQCILAGTLRWYSGRWNLAWLGLGILLAAGTPFYGAGGLMDFRIDFIAWCLFGAVLSLIMRSRVFASWGWSAAVGVAAALLILFRYLTAAYLAAILGSVFLGLCGLLIARRHNDSDRRQHHRRLGGLALVAAMVLLLAGPIVWHRHDVIRAYYLGQFGTGEATVRQQEFGVHNRWDQLLFYPRSIKMDHTGRHFLLVAGLALAGSLIAGWFRTPVGRPSTDPEVPRLAAAGALAAAFCAVPLTILTLFGSPSPVVGSIVVPALVWLVVLAAIGLSRFRSTGLPRPVRAWWVAGGAAVVLLLGFGNYAGALLHVTHLRREHRPDVRGNPAHRRRTGGLQPAVGLRSPASQLHHPARLSVPGRRAADRL